jgi:hypothetical protein
MAARTPPYRRGTAMEDSDVKELVAQWALANHAWVFNSAIGVNTTQFSGSQFQIMNSGGSIVNVAAFATGGGFTGLTVVTNCYGLVAAYITQAGTHVVAMGATAATMGGMGLPSVPSTAYLYGMVIIRPSSASAFTGGTTALDGTNASAIFINTNGPSALVLHTAPISVVPG